MHAYVYTQEHIFTLIVLHYVHASRMTHFGPYSEAQLLNSRQLGSGALIERAELIIRCNPRAVSRELTQHIYHTMQP